MLARMEIERRYRCGSADDKINLGVTPHLMKALQEGFFTLGQVNTGVSLFESTTKYYHSQTSY